MAAAAPTMNIAQMRGYINDHLPGSTGAGVLRCLDAILTDLANINARIDTINTWGATLATKLNADAGVTDTNYDITPDT